MFCFFRPAKGITEYCILVQASLAVWNQNRHYHHATMTFVLGLSWDMIIRNWVQKRFSPGLYVLIFVSVPWHHSNPRLWDARWQQSYQVNFHCLRSSEYAHITWNNGFYLVSLLPPNVPKVSHIQKYTYWKDRIGSQHNILICFLNILFNWFNFKTFSHHNTNQITLFY